MADFFEPKEEKKEVEETTEEVTKIKLGDDEYEEADLKALVDLGKLGKEVEEKYNTKLDRVYPEFTKATQKVKELEGEIEELAKKPEPEVPADASQPMDPLVEADKLGILTKQNIDTVFDQKYQERRVAEKLLDDCADLTKEIDGKDGRPAFETSSILEHMRNTGIRNPQDAYDLMHKEPLAEWREKQIKAAKPEGLVTETTSPAGGKEPPEVEVTAQNLEELTRESLYGPRG